VGALRAIFDCWQSGTKLAFEGEHYRFTRMQPFFDPGPIASPPPIHLGAVGPRMTRLAGAVADGIMTHPTHSAPRYLREVTRSEIADGCREAGRSDAGPALMAAGFVATGAAPADVARARDGIREYLAFLYSTPAYWRCLELFGWGEIGRRLHEHSRAGRWSEMGAVIPDAMLDALVPTAPYAEIAGVLRDAYADLADAITFPVPESPEHDATVKGVLERIRSG